MRNGREAPAGCYFLCGCVHGGEEIPLRGGSRAPLPMALRGIELALDAALALGRGTGGFLLALGRASCGARRSIARQVRMLGLQGRFGLVRAAVVVLGGVACAYKYEP